MDGIINGMRENTNRCKKSHCLVGNTIIYGPVKVVASEVTNDMVASVQPIFLVKSVGMAKKEINNAFLSIGSFKLLRVTQRLLRDTNSVVELERQIALFADHRLCL